MIISRTKAVICLLMCIIKANSQAIQLDTCTDPTVTAFDGYLDSQIFYANFDKDKQLAYLRFPNPFTTNQLEASVSVWMRLSRLGDYSRGVIFDCTDSIQGRINGTKITMALNTRADLSQDAKFTPTELEADVTADIEQLLQWNNYAFSFKNQQIFIHFNGVQVAAKRIPTSYLNKGFECTVGNQFDLTKNFNGHMRHLVFSNEGVMANQSINSKIRVQPSPVDSKIAAYYKFDKDWQQFESYYFTSISSIAKQVTIMSSFEPETVCYCTTIPQQFLRVSKETKLNPIDFRQSMTTSTGILDQDGIVFQFLINPVRQDQTASPDIEQLIFSVPRMFEVRLTNKSQSLRVDIFNQSVASSVTFRNYQFRFQTWTQYRIHMQPTKVVLSVDGVSVDSAIYNLNTFNLTSQQLQINQPMSLVYLLQSMQILDKQFRSVFNMTFTQEMLTGREQYLVSGKFIFETNNQLCSAADRINSTSFLSLSGDTCRDIRVYPSFGGVQSRGNLSSLSGSIKSSGSQLTIEFWMKDQKTATPTDLYSVILENQLGNSTKTSIALFSNPTSITQKSLRVYTNLTSNLSQFAEWKPVNRIQNNWIHVAIVSSASSLRILTFNHTSRIEEAVNVMGISLFPWSQELNTSLGSQLNGNNKFQGLLREFRIWSNSRTDFNIQTTRYASQVSSSFLVHYFRLNSGNELYSLKDSIAGYTIDEKATAFSSVAYAIDRDLIVCRPEQYFNGQCCQSYNLSAIDFQISYNPAKSIVSASLMNSTFVNPLLMNSIVANFSVINFGFKNNSAAVNQIRGLFNVNRTSGINVNSAQIDPIVFNMTVQARIYSIYGMLYKVVNKTFSLQCPNFFIQVNNQPQAIQGNTQYIVSPAADSYLQLQLRSVQNASTQICYNPVNDTIQSVTISQQLWSQQLSVVNTAITFSNIWTVSSNNNTAIFNKVAMSGQKWNRIIVRVTYGQGLWTETSVNLTYSTVSVVNQQFTLPTFPRHYIMNENMDVDLSNTATSDPVNLPVVTYGVICPTSLFSASDYNNFCQMTGRRFLLNTSLLKNIVFGQYYQFQFLLGVQGTNIVRTITGNFMFYQDGLSQSSCPSIRYQGPYEINKLDNSPVLIQPNAFLACGRVLWEPVSVVSTTTDTRSLKALTGIFAQPDVTNNMLQQAVFKDNLNVRALVGGQQMRVNSRITFRQVNQTGVRSPLNQTTLDVNFTANVKKNSIVSAVSVTNWNRTLINQLSIGFTETNFTLNASLSYDPDNPSMQLNYTWKCPAVINDVTCRRIQTGLRNNSLVFPMILKMQLGMLHGVNYDFQVTLNNIENPLAQPMTVILPITFALPSVNQTVPPEMKANACDFLDVYSNQFFKADLNSVDKVIQYNINNWDQFVIKAQAKSTCSSPAVEYMQMYFYLFDGQLVADNQVRTLFSEKAAAAILETTIASKDFLSLLKTQVLTPTQGGVYMFVKRVGSNRLSMLVDRVQFTRKYADLIAQISPDTLSVDQYQTFKLNASSSYDQETGTNSNFTYTWVCPQFSESAIPANCQTTGSVLTVTYTDRMNLQANDIQAYEYKVTVSQGSRQSQSTSTIVNIIQSDDYSACIDLNDKFSNSPLSYNFADQNRTMIWKKTQPVLFTFEVAPSVSNCDTVKVIRSEWTSSDPQIGDFWTLDALNANRIQMDANSLKYLTPNTNYSMLYTTKVQLGPEAANFFNKQTYLNVQILDNLDPAITAKQVFRYPQDTAVIMTASLQDSSLQITCSWDCPAELGGQSCSNDCTFNQTFVQLNTYARMIGNISVADLFGKSLDFTVTIYASNQVVQVAKSIYLIDSTQAQNPYSQANIDKCSIKIYGQSDLQKLKKSIPYQTVLYFGCDQNDILTSYIMNPKNFNLQWSVDGLEQGVDYVNKSGQLFIEPYAFAKIKEGYTANITLDIISATTGLRAGSLRRLQVDGSDQPPTTDPNAPATPIDDGTAQQDSNNTTTTNVDNQDNSNQPSDNNSSAEENSTQPSDNNSSAQDNSTQPSENTNQTVDNTTTQPQTNDNQSTDQQPPDQPPIVPDDNTTVPISQNDTTNQTQVTNSTLPAITVLDYNIMRTQNISISDQDRSLKQTINFKPPVITTFGKVQVTSQSGNYQYYVSNFTFRFSGYDTNPQQVIFFQLRALQDQLYKTFSILIPMKIFSQQNVDQYYSQVYLPTASEIYVDFFDGELNFLGSQELKAAGGPLESLNEMGEMSYTQIDKSMRSLSNKVTVGFVQIDDTSKIEFDMDMRKILQMSEFASLGGLQYMESFTDTILTTIVSYLKTYFVYMQAQLDPSIFQERRQQLINQKRVILTFYNLLKKSTATETQLASALSIFDEATKDFETLCYYSGEDPELIQTAVLFVQNIFKGQLQVVKMSNKKKYFDMIQTVTDTVYQTEVKQNNNTLVKVQQTNDSRSSRTIYRIDQDSNEYVLIKNANNNNEYVRFSDREGQLYQQTGVQTLTVQYDIQQPGQLSNAGTQSLITIKGTDNAGNMVDVSFPENSQYSFEMGFTLKAQANKTLYSRGPNNESVELGCVYFDTKTNAWNRTGVKVVDYNPQTLHLICKSYHLTQFSAQLFVIPPPSKTNATKNPTNSTQNTNQTVVNPIPIFIGDNQSYWSKKDFSYYVSKKPDYIAAIVVVGIIAVFFPLMSMILCRYNSKDATQDLVDFQPGKSSFILKLWSVMKVYHPVVSSVFAMTNPILAIPRAFQLLALELKVLTIVLTSLIHLVYIAPSQKEYLSNTQNKVYYCLIIIGCFLLIRNVFNKLKTGMYLQYSSISLQKNENLYGTQRPPENIRNRQYLVNNESPNELIGKSQKRLINDQVTIGQDAHEEKDQEDRFDHFEGGESDEIDIEQIDEGQGAVSQIEENIYQPKVRIINNNEYVDSIQRRDSHPEEEYKRQQYSNNESISARDHFKINMDGSPLELSKPFDGTSVQESAADDIEDQQSSNLQAEHIQVGIQGQSYGPSDESDSGKRPLNSAQKIPDQRNKALQSHNLSTAHHDSNDHQLKVKNEHSFKGTRILLFLLQILLVIGELVAIFILMRKVENKDSLVEWIKLCVGFSIIWTLCLDTLLCLIFAIIFGKTKSIQSTSLKIMAALLVQNFDERALIQTSLEIKGRTN